MKKVILLLSLLVGLLCGSAKSYFILVRYTLPNIPATIEISFPLLHDKEKALIINEMAIRAGIPPMYLAALMYNESTMGKNINHPDSNDVLDFALHETPEYHKERADKWGEYDPHIFRDNARIAALELAEEYEITKDWDLAVAGYKQGTNGVKLYGIDTRYVAKFRAYLAGIFI